MTAKIMDFLRTEDPPTPCLVVDLDVVSERHAELKKALPLAQIFYAVKANPAPDILRILRDEGANFDVASRAELDLCLSLGVNADRISFGNTIKKASDITHAHEKGVTLFTFDSEAELDKLAVHAPGAKVVCRVFVPNGGAQWPLSRKFGCAPDMARDLLLKARDRGLTAHGIAFHVGSQQTNIDAWDAAVEIAAQLFRALEEEGVTLALVNVGGGLPARYRSPVAEIDDYGRSVMHAMTRHFGNSLPAMMVEPGRYMVADAGIIQSEVVLISRKSYEDPTRWVYLDIGRFGGLAETEGEAIRYAISTEEDDTDPATRAKGPVILAGPTCDSADILYEKAGYEMPLDLSVGEKVQIHATGAYTTTYASVGFNGFAPVKAYYI